MRHDRDTIAAPATAPGGALSIVRVSGPEAHAICDRLFRGPRRIADAEGYTILYGRIADGNTTLDDVLVSVFRAPHSYTGEHAVEISCHGSRYITSRLLELLLQEGARMAEPGEFTVRAFFAGKLDLSQAEAVADLIASSSKADHALASTQMRGGYSAALGTLRDELLRLTSLLELELDFAEEEVEFADRNALSDAMERIGTEIDALRESFSLGNALREGITVAIVGAPNVGKSTLLNRLLNDERAMVSEIPGTTRDMIEECVSIDGIRFRFLDTAGIRATDDKLERMGIERTYAGIGRAQIVLQLTAPNAPDTPRLALHPGQTLLHVVNKIDLLAAGAGPFSSGFRQKDNPATSDPSRGDDLRTPIALASGMRPDAQHDTGQASSPTVPDLADTKAATGMTGLCKDAIAISARTGDGIDTLRRALCGTVATEALYQGDPIVSNARHFEALTAAAEALARARAALADGLPADLLSEEIRQVLYHLGTITGEITNEEVLSTIFSKFCVGK